jgi:hypothetical protein
MISSNTPRASRFQLLALAAVLGLALVGLTQCRSISDRVTGVQLTAPQSLGARSGCTRRCDAQYKAALIAEQARYIAAKRACGHNYACKKQDDIDHMRILRTLQHNKTLCKHSCYNEGAGSAGA